MNGRTRSVWRADGLCKGGSSRT